MTVRHYILHQKNILVWHRRKHASIEQKINRRINVCIQFLLFLGIQH